MKLNLSKKIILFSIALVFFTSMTIGAFSYFWQYEEITESIKNEKKNEIKILSSHILSKIEEVRNDVLFLSATPPIKGIIRSTNNNGLDLFDGSTLDEWKDRLATIFQEILYAKKNYIQVRFIGFDEGGRELVRVDRSGNKVLRIEESNLQEKENESYFKEAFELKANNIYLSEFNLNREFGKIVFPHQMVLRSAVPIYIKGNTPFGLVIINIDYTEIFNSLRDSLSKEHEYFISDRSGDILLHSNPKIRIIDEKNNFLKIQEFLPAIAKNNNYKEDIFSFDLDDRTGRIVVGQKIRFNSINNDDYITLFLVIDKKLFTNTIKKRTSGYIYLSLIIILIAVIMTLFFSRSFSFVISKLILFATKISSGNYGETISINRYDEIGLLANTLNKLSIDLDAKDRELKDQQEALNASAIVAETDTKGKIIYANEKFIEISKFSREELIGRDHRIINSGFHSKEFFNDMWSSIKAGKVWLGEIKNKAKDGSIYWVDTTIYPIKNRLGEIEKFVAIRYDITDKKEIMHDLEIATREARHALKAKETFFANMSHEIRTPLNGIIGFTDLLLDENLSTDVYNQIKSIKTCSNILNVLINDILDISKIDAGMLEMENISFSLAELVESTIEVFQVEAQKKNIEILHSINENIPDYLISDPLRIRQVLINLIGNAIKFTKNGNISINVIQLEIIKNTDDFFIEFRVKDDGIGISKENQDKLFNSYTQVDAGTSRKYGGTGLGLSICKKLVSLLGGDIGIESVLGEGATFKFTIKTKEGVQDAQTLDSTIDVGEVSVSEKLILVAEDNSFNRDIIQKILNKLGHSNIEFANNGIEAIEHCKKLKYDIIFMDVQMPEMGGIEATKRIRSEDNFNKETVIIGLSANVFESDIENGLASGMNHYLKKPINQKKLKEVLLKLK